MSLRVSWEGLGGCCRTSERAKRNRRQMELREAWQTDRRKDTSWRTDGRKDTLVATKKNNGSTLAHGSYYPKVPDWLLDRRNLL